MLLVKVSDLGLAVGEGTDFVELFNEGPAEGNRQLAVAKDLLVNKSENG